MGGVAETGDLLEELEALDALDEDVLYWVGPWTLALAASGGGADPL